MGEKYDFLQKKKKYFSSQYLLLFKFIFTHFLETEKCVNGVLLYKNMTRIKVTIPVSDRIL